MSNNTILFTPSFEQIQEIAAEHPELNNKIKEKVMLELYTEGVRYVTNRLQKSAVNTFEKTFLEVEKKVLKKSFSNTEFTDETKKSIESIIEERFSEELEAEFEEYLKSPEFKKVLREELHKRTVDIIVKGLDEMIVKEANKFVKM